MTTWRVRTREKLPFANNSKPHKPLRPLRVYGDENNPPKAFPQKTIHSRNKSSPSLSTLASNGSSNIATKRSAFADVSNMFQRNRHLVKDDLSVSSKLPSKGEDKPAGAFLRPAQRPLKDVSNFTKAFPPSSKHVTGSNGLLSTATHKLLAKKASVINSNILAPPAEAAPTSKPSTRNSWNEESDYKHVERVSNSQDVKQTQEVQTSLLLPEILAEAVTHIDLTPTFPESQPEAVAGASSQLPMELPQETLPAIESVPDVASEGTISLIEAVRKTSISSLAPAVDPAVLAVGPAVPDIEPAISAVETSLPGVETIATVQPIEPVLQSSVNGAASTKTGISSYETEQYLDEEDDLQHYEDEGYITARSLRSRAENITGNATTTLVPRNSLKARKEIATARELVESMKTIEDYEDEAADTSMVAEYGDEIFEYLREMEEKMQPNPHYMNYQTEIQWSMRAVLVDWIVQVHTRFNLLPETLFLTVNYMDRFLSAKIVSLNKLQLVGATALFVAAKYEEINCPSVHEIVYMVDNGYSVDEVLKAERFMLSMLQFELGWPGPMSFLRRISKADDYDLETRTLAKYLLEVTIVDERFLGCPPSFTAAGAHCLARQLLKKGHWSPAHIYYSNYTYAQLFPLVQLIHECCTDPLRHHAAVYEKYQDKRYKYASRYVKQEMQSGFQVPDVAVQGAVPVLSYFDHHHLPWMPEYMQLPWQ